MDISSETLDNIFIPYFEALEEGKIVNIVDLNWYFDFRNKSGSLTKSELEHVINRQIQLSKIEIISESEFEMVSFNASQEPYVASQEVIEKSAEEYSKQFWKKYNESENT
jgi:hypothetical protein